MTTADPADHEGSGAEGILRVRCPRCGNDVVARFYGPCDDCRSALRAAHRGEGRDVPAPAYEPKMNVTPNAVALRE
jgi:hypothetical protein